jgi:hypothetical protein
VKSIIEQYYQPQAGKAMAQHQQSILDGLALELGSLAFACFGKGWRLLGASVLELLARCSPLHHQRHRWLLHFGLPALRPDGLLVSYVGLLGWSHMLHHLDTLVVSWIFLEGWDEDCPWYQTKLKEVVEAFFHFFVQSDQHQQLHPQVGASACNNLLCKVDSKHDDL